MDIVRIINTNIQVINFFSINLYKINLLIHSSN